MSTEYIITQITYGNKDFLAAALYDDTSLCALRVEPSESHSMVGNIYLGVVDSISKNIASAFINIGQKDLCFLTLRKAPVQVSTRLPVTITKDAATGKQPCCTTKLSIAGKYAVVSDEKEGISFSSKLTAQQKELLKKWIDPSVAQGIHILVRTNASQTEKAVLNEELTELKDTLTGITDKASKAKSFSLLYKPTPFYLRMLRDFRTPPERVLTDIPIIGKETGIGIYEDRNLPLAEKKGLNHDIEKLLDRHVWLKSGGFLIIEQTEAFVTIDVNTGRCSKGKIAEETYRKVNLEAAEEAVRQISLRNLSGMILIDFINMTNPDHNDELIHVMKKLVKSDPVHTDVLDLTKLGILEIVRQKISPPLAEVLKSQGRLSTTHVPG